MRADPKSHDLEFILMERAAELADIFKKYWSDIQDSDENDAESPE